jgi:hypothetical protein
MRSLTEPTRLGSLARRGAFSLQTTHTCRRSSGRRSGSGSCQSRLLHFFELTDHELAVPPPQGVGWYCCLGRGPRLLYDNLVAGRSASYSLRWILHQQERQT